MVQVQCVTGIRRMKKMTNQKHKKCSQTIHWLQPSCNIATREAIPGAPTPGAHTAIPRILTLGVDD